MALFQKTEGTEDGTANARWFVYGRDHDKPVRFQIRPVPASVDRGIQRRVWGVVKTRKAGKESVATGMERNEQYAVLKGVYALVACENFNVGLLDELAAKQYCALLGVEAKVGGEVCFDGKLEGAPKETVLTDFPTLARWVVRKSDSITEADVEEEDEATEAF